MLDRLAGLETEYALRFHPRTPDGERVPNGTLFERLLTQVRTKMPVAPAIVSDLGYFLASGGALKLERIPFLVGVPTAGLVEGSTPECRSPRQLLLYQRAQDALLSKAAAASGGTDGTAFLLKNTHDGHGNYSGSHENYEAVNATGFLLFCWRAGAVLLLLMLVAVMVVLGIVLMPLLIVWAICQIKMPMASNAVMTRVVVFLLTPAILLGELLVRLTAFHSVRRPLLPFLVSRQVLCGAGMVHADGRFTLSPRVEILSTVFSTASEFSRGIYYFGHVWKGLIGMMLGDSGGGKRVFRSRLRLQITVGDANMAHTAEYLKFGTTMLVLDAIEAGLLNDAPSLHRPMHALRTINADPDLQATVRLGGGRHWTALQIQRYYLDACRRLVAQTPQRHDEAETILSLWAEALDALEQEPSRMVGKLDWVTKRHLISTAGQGASVEAWRKIDLKYHELSTDGYYNQLEAAGVAPTLVEPEEVLDAIGKPPEGTPAALRGRLIRNHASEEQRILAGWETVLLKEGVRQRVISLTDAAALATVAGEPKE